MDRSITWWGVSTGLGLLLAFFLVIRRAFHEPDASGLDVQLLFWGGPFLLAAVCGYGERVAPWRWAIPIASGVALADAVAIVQDGLRNPTSHNLLPIELALSFGVAFGLAALGAYLGASLR